MVFRLPDWTQRCALLPQTSTTPPPASLHLHQWNLTWRLAGSLASPGQASPSSFFTVPSELEEEQEVESMTSCLGWGGGQHPWGWEGGPLVTLVGLQEKERKPRKEPPLRVRGQASSAGGGASLALGWPSTERALQPPDVRSTHSPSCGRLPPWPQAGDSSLGAERPLGKQRTDSPPGLPPIAAGWLVRPGVSANVPQVLEALGSSRLM